MPEPKDELTRSRLRAQGRRDTKPELELRQELHRLGLRYRVDRSPIRGVRWRADVVFGPARVAVFVDGCFWHGCPEHFTLPTNNRAWWREKIAANQARDARIDEQLREAGWLSLRYWEHEDKAWAAADVAATVTHRLDSLRG